MPTVPLPDEPDLGQLRKQAKDLRRAVRTGDADALAEVAARHPGAPTEAVASFRLGAAQLVVARRYGFASWARLKHHVEVIERYSRFPERGENPADQDPADTFLRLACLNYSDDSPRRWARARRLLLDHPEITERNAYAAAAACDVPALARTLDADPASARRAGGPVRVEPLFYLAYARHEPAIAREAVLAAARLLLDAGGNPNEGYLWHGLPTPFTLLTGVFGEGERGPAVQPRHPHSLALGRVLLEAGADPNDGQSLYNRMFEPDDDHLELLFEFGLGTGDGGPWRQRLGHLLDPPAELVRGQLAWAITHGMADRVRLLVDHGTDVATPFDDGVTPVRMAATTGHPELVDHLVAHGAPNPGLAPADALAAAALAADRAAVDRLRRGHPELLGTVRSARPALVTWAAACGSAESVELLVELGFDVNAKGRTDVPSDQPWQTALHRAAETGDIELARTLLRLGADPDIKDARFDATALGWAHFFGQDQLAELLAPLTTPEPDAEDDA